jgi:hypothetical protein
MKRFLKIMGIFMGGCILLAAILIILLLIPNKKAEQEEKKQHDQFIKEQEFHRQQFIDLVRQLESIKVISNSKQFVDVYNQTDKLIQLSTYTYQQNAHAGLQLLCQMCVSFYSSGEASEDIGYQLSKLFFEDKGKFLSGLEGKFDKEAINCALQAVDFPPDISEVAGFKYVDESNKLASFLRSHSRKGNLFVAQLAENFEKRAK